MSPSKNKKRDHDDDDNSNNSDRVNDDSRDMNDDDYDASPAGSDVIFRGARRPAGRRDPSVGVPEGSPTCSPLISLMSAGAPARPAQR